MESTYFGKDGFIWWKGVIEDRKDPIFLGRVRVRIFGWHTDDKTLLPTSDLPWAMPSLPLDNGRNPVGPKEGDWCWGFFLDGNDAQKPVVVGYIPGIDEAAADPNKGFSDPTDPAELVPGSTPRPVNMSVSKNKFTEPTISKTAFIRYIAKLDPPEEITGGLLRLTDALFLNKSVLKLVSELPTGLANVASEISKMQSELTEEVKKQITAAIDFVKSKVLELVDLVKSEIASAVDGTIETIGRFANENILPGTNLAFGELAKDFDITKSKLDVNKNGKFDKDDVIQLIKNAVSDGGFFDGYVESIPEVPMSSYPLADRLNEPSTSRLSRNEKIEETIVAYKKQKLVPIEGAGFSGNTMGGTSDSPTSFVEPPTPYAAVYPYNHVYESESGHAIEVDDTPGAERLHRYHRSGTFNEVHPDGVEVNRVVNSQYNIIYGDYFNSTGFTYHVDAKTGIRMKSGANFNIQTTGNLNQQVGVGLNSIIGADITSHAGGNSSERVGGNKVSLTEGDSIESIGGSEWKKIAEGLYINATGGPVKIKSTQKIQLISDDSIDLIAPVVNVNPMMPGGGSKFDATGLSVAGAITSLVCSTAELSSARFKTLIGSAYMKFTSPLIEGLEIQGNTMTSMLYKGNPVIFPFSPTALPNDYFPPILVPPLVIPPTEIENPADAENNQLLEDLLKNSISSGDGGPKWGFFIPNGVIGDVYKPVSDSNGNLVTLSATMGSHELREAIPTAALESVLIKYEDPSGAITEWRVVRPVHVPGELIDTPVKMDMFEDGIRQLARWSKPGREYPKQMFWMVNGRAMLILDSAERHQCKFGPYNDKIS